MKVLIGIVLLVPSSQALEIIPSSLPIAVIHRVYGPEPIQVTGGGRCTVNNISFRLIQGRLPEGMWLSSGGYLGGTPREAGQFPFLVRIANDCLVLARSFVLRVEGAPVLQVWPLSLHLQYELGQTPVLAERILIAGSWRDLPYWIEAEDADWIDLRPLLGRTPPEGHALSSDPVTIVLKPSKLKPGIYRTSIRVLAGYGAAEARLPLTLRVTVP
ncbi:MAG: hypothetical protein NZV14_16345 [Bryobacteraceae bacterium]|nr:hypothetical protein [Bryobacteraceae bacterium]MDW8379733.1 hypothetical protein [Bryobacterales bacterium]